MKIVGRLYLKEFLSTLAFTALGLAALFSLFHLIEKLDGFMKHSPSLGILFAYTILNIPKNLFYLLPAAVLICSLFVFTKAIKRNEIVALKAGGARLKLILLPFVFLGFILSAFAFFTGEFLMPLSLSKAKELKLDIESSELINSGALIKPSKKSIFKKGTIWLRGNDGSIIRIGLYDIADGTAHNVTIFLVNEKGISEHIEAEKAYWNYEGWKLVNVKKYSVETGTVEEMEEMAYSSIGSPQYFKDKIKKTQEMRLGELFVYIKRLKKSGYNNPKLIVDFNSRLSYPLINLFMLIIGISLPLRRNISKGLVAAGIGFLFSLIYWVGYILSLSLGNTGIVPPALSPWLMPSLFAFISVKLYQSIPE